MKIHLFSNFLLRPKICLDDQYVQLSACDLMFEDKRRDFAVVLAVARVTRWWAVSVEEKRRDERKEREERRGIEEMRGRKGKRT